MNELDIKEIIKADVSEVAEQSSLPTLLDGHEYPYLTRLNPK